MTETWLDITEGGTKARSTMQDGLTRVGGAGCDLEIASVQGDELHFWSDPPKVILVGAATTPLLNGRAFEEAELAGGDSIQWGGAVLVYGREKSQVLVEEFVESAAPAAASPARAITQAPTKAPTPASVGAKAPEPTEPTQAASGGGTDDGQRAWKRLMAGMLVELGIANKAEAKRWQGAVVRGQFDADACARDLLGANTVPADDPRLLERAGRMQRDLLMMPMQRGVQGASRRVRVAGKSGAAYVLSNAISIVVYSVILAVIFMLLRAQKDFSVDGMIDRWLELVSFG